MEAADHHRHASRPERAGDVERAGILVRLHAHDPDQAEPVVPTKLREQLLDFHARVDLVDHRDVDGGVGSEHLALPRIAAQAVKHGERVRRNESAHPLDNVAVVVVMRRLDQHELKAPLRPRRCISHAEFSPPPIQLAGDAVVHRNCNTPMLGRKRPESTTIAAQSSCVASVHLKRQAEARGLRRPSDIYFAFVSIASSDRSHQVRGLASTTCEAGTVAGLRAAAAGFCAGAVAGACAIGWLLAAPGMYLRPPLSLRSWLTQSSGYSRWLPGTSRAMCRATAWMNATQFQVAAFHTTEPLSKRLINANTSRACASVM